jgi:hypothetical protein
VEKTCKKNEIKMVELHLRWFGPIYIIQVNEDQGKLDEAFKNQDINRLEF